MIAGTMMIWAMITGIVEAGSAGNDQASMPTGVEA